MPPLTPAKSSKSSQPVSSPAITYEEIRMENLKEAQDTLAETPIGKENLPISPPSRTETSTSKETTVRPGAESRASSRKAYSQQYSPNKAPVASRSASVSKAKSKAKSKPKAAPSATRSSTVSKPNGPKRSSTSRHNDAGVTPYARPQGTEGKEHVLAHLPSCSSLPQLWTPIHDRFIAYLATHAPLTADGRIPREEEFKERWSTSQIIFMLRERFPKLAKAKIRSAAIEQRLDWLDVQSNDYFGIPYGGYEYEDWGSGI